MRKLNTRFGETVKMKHFNCTVLMYTIKMKIFVDKSVV